MISVCMATYNGERFLREQIDSILSQLGEGDELVISDDGSTDNTINIINSYDDKRIKLFFNEESHGVVGNFENAIKNSNGDIIFLSDQDDVWLDNKVEVVRNYLNSVDLVVHDARLVDVNFRDIGNYYSIRKPRKGYWACLYQNSFMGSCMAFNRKVVPYVMPFPSKIQWHDMWIGLMSSLLGKTIFVEDKLILYRKHGDNNSTTGERSTFSIVFRLKYRFDMFVNSIIRSFSYYINRL